MIGFGRGLAGTALMGVCAALMGGAFGCELIASVDRSLIDGAGGEGGSSSASSSSTGGSECTTATDCLGDPASVCVVNACEGGKCGTAPVPAGPIAAQTAGDCKSVTCDGKGALVDVNDDTDKPDDKKACTDDVCTAGVPSNPPTAAGSACGTDLTCDGKGDCTGCATAASCPGTSDDCQTQTCTNGVCGTSFTAAGTATTAQTTGDCKVKQCDGAGAAVDAVLATDVPVDGNECTDDVCTGNTPSNPNTMSGGTCTTGGKVCNGSGACVACVMAATCPAAANECQVATCTAGACGIANVPAGTATAAQTAGNCKKNTCDGAGNIVNGNDNTDLPDDSNPCTNDVCTGGVPSHTPAASGTTCGGTQVCDGAGVCTGCVTAATCAGTDTECQTRTCTGGVCGFSFAAAGTVTTAQTAGDCKKNQCDGAGVIVPATDSTDLPVDANQCTNDVCTGGVPSNPPIPSGSACSQMGGTLCNGSSACVACLMAADCAGTDTECHSRTCTLGVCGVSNTAAGTMTTMQTANDCQETQCNGSGAIVSVAKNTDVPVDGIQCTNDICMAGVPSNPPAAAGTLCSQMGGEVCDGSGVCAPPSCTDGVKNGVETGVDCGGSSGCPKCALNSGCTTANDCTSGTCTGNVCSLINGCDLSTAMDLTAVTSTIVTFANGNLTYAPKCIKVSAGTVVTFNGSFANHPLLGGVAGTPASSGPFIPLTSTGTTKDFTMSAAGTFPYYCTAHFGSGMSGAVFVVP